MNLLSRNSRILYTFKYIQIPKVWSGMICALCNIFTQKGLAQLEHLVLSVFLDLNSILILTGEDQVSEGHVSSLWLSWNGEPTSPWLCWSLSCREKMLVQVTPWTSAQESSQRGVETQGQLWPPHAGQAMEELMVRKRAGSLCEFCRVNFCVWLHGYGEGRPHRPGLVLGQIWRAARVVVTKSDMVIASYSSFKRELSMLEHSPVL